jgi:DNA-binding NtrC family response regulator
MTNDFKTSACKNSTSMDTSAKIKIFLVDDDVMFAESLRYSLSEERAEIRSFSTGEDCIKCLGEEPAIIVLDYSLNNTLNGVQVLNKIKQESPDTEVIMLSGVDNKSIMKDTMKYGAYDYIEKGESALYKIKKEVKQLCDEIESSNELEKENKKIMWINAAIIVLIVVVFILNRLK